MARESMEAEVEAAAVEVAVAVESLECRPHLLPQLLRQFHRCWKRWAGSPW
jgi:hypothetical protein